MDPLPDTLTELAAPVARTDRTMLVKDAARIPVGGRIALAARPDGADLPNFNLTDEIVRKERQADGNWLLTFPAQLYFEFPAGTKVRGHRSAGGYATAFIGELPAEFKRIECFMEGFGTAIGRWFPGTVKADLCLFSPESGFSFRNVRIEVVEKQ